MNDLMFSQGKMNPQVPSYEACTENRPSDTMT